MPIPCVTCDISNLFVQLGTPSSEAEQYHAPEQSATKMLRSNSQPRTTIQETSGVSKIN